MSGRAWKSCALALLVVYLAVFGLLCAIGLLTGYLTWG